MFLQLCLRNAVIAPIGRALTAGNLHPGMEVHPTEFQRSSWPCLFGFMVSWGIKYVIRYIFLLFVYLLFLVSLAILCSMSLNRGELSNLAHLGHQKGACVCCFSRGVCSWQESQTPYARTSRRTAAKLIILLFVFIINKAEESKTH